MMKPTELVSLTNDSMCRADVDSDRQPNSYGSHVYIQPLPPSTSMYIAGDTNHNVGVFVSAILKRPEISLPAKYAFVYTEVIPFKDMLLAWSEVTGRRATFIQCSLQEYEEVWVSKLAWRASTV